MPDSFTAAGLTVKSSTEIKSDLNTGFQGIYGSDINIDPNSPDGQIIGIFTQMLSDIRELLLEINSSFDPSQCIGIQQDWRYAINNISRAGGTYTIQPIDITTDRTLTLSGLDAAFNDPNGTGYTVQDNAGNQFILQDTSTLTAGTTTKNFRARDIGQVNTTVNTITTQSTIVLGVTAINNSSSPISIGQNQETDAQFKLRQQQSVALSSTGYLNGLLGNVLALPGVVSAVLYENVTSSTDADGIPAHGIWLVVDGGANTDIGNQIYTRKSYGANMKGSVDVPITTASGATFDALFDRPTAEDLYIQFNIQATRAGQSFDLAAIKAYMVANIAYTIGQFADTSSLTVVAANAINISSGGFGVPTELQISIDGSTWVDYLETATKDKQFVVDVSRITITVL